MENKTRVRDAFTAWGDVFRAVFGKQEDNQMLKDLRIVKGVKAGIGYLIWIGFVMPAKIFTFILSPNWTWVNFVQRHLVSPFFELDAISGGESPSQMLAKLYENNLNYLENTKNSGVQTALLKPDTSTLERLMTFAKIRVIFTLLIFAIGAILLWEVFDAMIELGGLLIGMVGGLGALGLGGGTGGLSGGDGIIAGLTFGAILTWGAWIIGGALIAYMMMFAIRFLVESVRSVMYADRDMIKNFVDDSLHYTISKSIELYGEDTALGAYDLLLENVVINKERYVADGQHYLKLEDKYKTAREDEEYMKEITGGDDETANSK